MNPEAKPQNRFILHDNVEIDINVCYERMRLLSKSLSEAIEDPEDTSLRGPMMFRWYKQTKDFILRNYPTEEVDDSDLPFLPTMTNDLPNEQLKKLIYRLTKEQLGTWRAKVDFSIMPLLRDKIQSPER